MFFDRSKYFYREKLKIRNDSPTKYINNYNRKFIISEVKTMGIYKKIIKNRIFRFFIIRKKIKNNYINKNYKEILNKIEKHLKTI